MDDEDLGGGVLVRRIAGGILVRCHSDIQFLSPLCAVSGHERPIMARNARLTSTMGKFVLPTIPEMEGVGDPEKPLPFGATGCN